MVENDKLKTIALKVLSKTNMPSDEVYGFAVITILMVISLILTSVRILQECNKNKLSSTCSIDDKCGLYEEQIHTFSNRRGWFTKMRLKKILRKELSPEDYSKYSLSIINALLETGETLTKDDIQVLVEAANV